MKNSTQLIQAMLIPFTVVFLLWVIHWFNLSYPEEHLHQYGVYPRTLKGIVGIFTSPFIHDTSSWSHIINNSPPFFVLLWLTINVYKRDTFKITLFIWITSGFWVWLAARSSFHIGASSVIYGLAFFLFFSGVFKRNKQLMGISLLVAFLYGSMIWGLFPLEEGVSFEGHTFGAIAGIIMSVYMKNKGPQRDRYDLTVKPEFEEFVEAYNQELFEYNYWLEKQTTTHTQEDHFEVFFDYIKKDENNKL